MAKYADWQDTTTWPVSSRQSEVVQRNIKMQADPLEKDDIEEKEAFFVGNGSGKPTRIFHTTGGAELGVTVASATTITADELIDLVYSLRSPYRKMRYLSQMTTPLRKSES